MAFARSIRVNRPIAVPAAAFTRATQFQPQAGVEHSYSAPDGAEAPGFATIMAGARSLQPDDDALLKAMTPVLDSLYASYAGVKAKD